MYEFDENSMAYIWKYNAKFNRFEFRVFLLD